VATKEKLTREQFLALPETKPGSEFIAGEVMQKPMPTIAHGIIQRLLSFVFTLYVTVTSYRRSWTRLALHIRAAGCGARAADRLRLCTLRAHAAR
jgi:Uma2 family endonuclease